MNTTLRRRRGFTMTELVVAASLLVSLMAIVAPLTVRSGQLWKDTRHQQLALDELTNHLERLTALVPDQRNQAISQLQLTEHFQAVLPNATIAAETQRDSDGMRLVMSLKWERRAGQPRSVELVGWLDATDSTGPGSEEAL